MVAGVGLGVYIVAAVGGAVLLLVVLWSFVLIRKDRARWSVSPMCPVERFSTLSRAVLIHACVVHCMGGLLILIDANCRSAMPDDEVPNPIYVRAPTQSTHLAESNPPTAADSEGT